MTIPQDQSSQEWLNWRREKIGASDIAIIMGESPWCTPYVLWKRKLGFTPEQAQNPAMERGKQLEGHVRELVNAQRGADFQPIVLAHAELEWAVASLDGFDEKSSEILEIKCPSKKTHEEARSGKVPRHYFLQIQWQLFVADLETCHYVSYLADDDIVSLKVERDDELLVDSILPAAAEFYQHLVTMTEPARQEGEHIAIETREFEEAAEEYKQAEENYKLWADKKEKARQKLISCTDDSNCVGCGLKLTRCSREGNVDWKRLWKELTEFAPELAERFSLEDYRQQQIGFWKISSLS